MDYKEFKFKLDMNRYNRLNIQPVQGESAVKLIPTLVHNSQPYNLMDSEVRCLFRKPDGTVSYIDGVILDADKGEVEFKLTNQVLLLSGSVVGLIDVTGTIGIARTWMFTMDVQPGMPLTDVLSIDEFPAVEQMLIDVADIKANFNAIVAGVTVDGEVILSRGVFDTLGHRLDAIDSDKANQLEFLGIIERLDKLTAKDIPVYDLGRHFTTHDVEKVLDEVGSELRAVTFTGHTQTESIKKFPVGSIDEDVDNTVLRGVTLVNLVKNGDFSGGVTGWTSLYTTASVVSNECSFTVTQRYGGIKSLVKVNTNDKVYTSLELSATSSEVKAMLRQPNAPYATISTLLSNGSGLYQRLSTVSTILQVDSPYSVEIRDERVSGWGLVKVKNVMTVNLTSLFGAGNEPSKEVMDDFVSQGYFEGIKSIENPEVKAVGKNLFTTSNILETPTTTLSVIDKDTFSMRMIGYETGKPAMNSVFKENTRYVFSGSSMMGANAAAGSAYRLSIKYTDGTSESIFNSIATKTSFMKVSALGKTISGLEHTASNINGEFILYNFQIEENTVTTAYEPYKSSQMKALTTLSRLPNGIRDRIYEKDGQWYLEKNVGEYVLKSTDVTALGTNLADIDYVAFSKPTDYFGYGTTNSSDLDKYLVNGYGRASYYSANYTLNCIDKVSGNWATSVFVVAISKNRYATLALAQTALTGTKILYQLATPEVTNITDLVTGKISSFRNGTVYNGSDSFHGELTFDVVTTRSSQVEYLLDEVVALDNAKANKVQENWIIPSLLNGWINFAGITQAQGYYKDSLGIVHLRGLVSNGILTDLTTVFILPLGYRPLQEMRCAAVNADKFCELRITILGEVKIIGVIHPNWLSFDNISFRTV